METEPGGRAGFTLIEVMVALVVAGLFLSVLGRAFASAWGATRTPIEIVSAVSIARFVLAPGSSLEDSGAGRLAGFSFERNTGDVTILTRPSGLAPAPPSAAPAPPGGGPPAAQPQHLDLRRISVVVTTPSRRRLSFDTIRLAITKP